MRLDRRRWLLLALRPGSRCRHAPPWLRLVVLLGCFRVVPLGVKVVGLFRGELVALAARPETFALCSEPGAKLLRVDLQALGKLLDGDGIRGFRFGFGAWHAASFWAVRVNKHKL